MAPFLNPNMFEHLVHPLNTIYLDHRGLQWLNVFFIHKINQFLVSESDLFPVRLCKFSSAIKCQHSMK